MKKTALIFILLLGFCFSHGFSKKLAVLPEITIPISIDIYDNELYVLDEVVVHVYSLKDFRLKRKFGKKGEGKGKIRPNTEVPLAMNIVDGNVYLNSQIKMIKFSKEGEILQEQQIPFSFQIIPFGKNFVSIKITVRHDLQGFSVTLCDPGLKKLKTLYTRERIPRKHRGKLPIPPELIIIRSTDDKLFVFDQRKGLVIDIYDLEGEKDKTLKMDYQKIKVTDLFKRDAEVWFRAQPSFHMAAEELREMIFFPDYLPVMRNFIIKDKKLYIQTYKIQDSLSEFIILDLQGNFLNKAFLPGFANSPVQFSSSKMFTFKDEKYYYLAEGENGWEIHVEEIK